MDDADARGTGAGVERRRALRVAVGRRRAGVDFGSGVSCPGRAPCLRAVRSGSTAGDLQERSRYASEQPSRSVRVLLRCPCTSRSWWLASPLGRLRDEPVERI